MSAYPTMPKVCIGWMNSTNVRSINIIFPNEMNEDAMSPDA